MPSSIATPDLCQKCNKAAMLMPRGSKWVCLDCWIKEPPKVHEILARTRRVFVFAEFLAKHNITPDECRRMTDEHWDEVTREIEVECEMKLNPPSLETKLAIIQALEAVQAVARV